MFLINSRNSVTNMNGYLMVTLSHEIKITLRYTHTLLNFNCCLKNFKKEFTNCEIFPTISVNYIYVKQSTIIMCCSKHQGLRTLLLVPISSKLGLKRFFWPSSAEKSESEKMFDELTNAPNIYHSLYVSLPSYNRSCSDWST